MYLVISKILLNYINAFLKNTNNKMNIKINNLTVF